MVTNKNTIIKTAVLQTTASKGTSCFTKQSLKLRESKSRVILNILISRFVFLKKSDTRNLGKVLGVNVNDA